MSIETIVGIFDNETFEQMFVNAGIINSDINNSSQVISHPLEDGSKTSDHQVYNLIKISMTVRLSDNDFVSTHQSISKSYNNSVKHTIQTKVNVYKNMVIESMPHSETSESGVVMNISFVEFKSAATASTYVPKYASDSNSVDRGVQRSSSVTEDKKQSILSKVFS